MPMDAIGRLLAGLVLAVPVLAAAAPAAAQSWPSQQVRVVVAFAPGGPTDIVGRIISDRLQQRWGQSVIVENRGGAGGSIAARLVAKADPDGYTILFNSSAYAVTPSLMAAAGYEPEKDLKTAVIVATGPNLVVASPGLKANNLKEVIELTKNQKLAFGSAGAGTTPHLSGERLFREFAKVDIPHTPFTGSGPVMNALLGDHIALGVMSLAGTIELVTSGKLKGIAVTAKQRLASLPDVPTAIEQGYGDSEESTWVALIVPPATPDTILDKINADTNMLLTDKDTVEKLAGAGLIPVGGTRAEAQAYVRQETAKWAGVIAKLGLGSK